MKLKISIDDLENSDNSVAIIMDNDKKSLDGQQQFIITTALWAEYEKQKNKNKI